MAEFHANDWFEPPTHLPQVKFLLTDPRRFCCISYLPLRVWFHMWRLYFLCFFVFFFAISPSSSASGLRGVGRGGGGWVGGWGWGRGGGDEVGQCFVNVAYPGYFRADIFLYIFILFYCMICKLENKKCSDTVPYESSNQSVHSHNLIRVFVVRMKNLCILGFQICTQYRVIWNFDRCTCPEVLFLPLQLI